MTLFCYFQLFRISELAGRFPNAVMQAGAKCLNTIVTNINGCNKINKTAENGIILPPKDEIALFESIQTFVAGTIL